MKPITFIATGDIPVAKMLRKMGYNEMNILLRQRELGLKDEVRRVTPWKGVNVTCIAGKQRNEVLIDVALPKHKGGEPLVIVSERKECTCFPHLSMGIIDKVNEEPGYHNRLTYDIEICAVDYYVQYNGAYDANFGAYYKGQRVLVTIGDEMDEWISPLDCDRNCLVDKPRFNVLMVSPIHLINGMIEWSKIFMDKKHAI